MKSFIRLSKEDSYIPVLVLGLSVFVAIAALGIDVLLGLPVKTWKYILFISSVYIFFGFFTFRYPRTVLLSTAGFNLAILFLWFGFHSESQGFLLQWILVSIHSVIIWLCVKSQVEKELSSFSQELKASGKKWFTKSLQFCNRTFLRLKSRITQNKSE